MKNKLMKSMVLVLMVMMISGMVFMKAPTDFAMADTSQTVKLVTVSGVGEITIAPDLALINVGVQTKNNDAAKAQQENAKLMKAVIDAIKAKGIKAEDIKTTGYSIYQTYDYVDNKPSTPYYIASNTINIKVNDITKVGELIDVATAAGANSIDSIRFTVKDDSKYYEEALKLAMANAKNKATAIMGSFGKKPGVPYSVNESSNGGRIFYDYYPAKASMDTLENAVTTPIESGEITVTANVSVSYDY